MGKAIRIEDRKLLQALEEGADYIIADKKHFVLVEITDETDEFYNVTDPEEAKVVREALRDNSNRLSGEEARAYLDARLKEYGVN